MSQKRYHPTLKLKDHFAHVLLHAPELITYHPKTPGRATPSGRASPAPASRSTSHDLGGRVVRHGTWASFA